jgi:hypothetical protein
MRNEIPGQFPLAALFRCSCLEIAVQKVGFLAQCALMTPSRCPAAG